jgi:signal transduction histidine kinase
LESRLQEGAFSQGDTTNALDDLRDYLGLIRSEAFRCKSITNGLLDFSRARASEHSLLNLSDVINSAARLLAHQQRDGKIEFQIQTHDEPLPLLSGDAGQLQQAIIALATNAVDAMPLGGTLTISARHEGEKVLVEVSDTGVGIAPENIAKIFEPFFTTKEVGRGTGLGLAVCYGILTEHGGSLDVQSTPAPLSLLHSQWLKKSENRRLERATSSANSDCGRRSESAVGTAERTRTLGLQSAGGS